MVVIKSDPTPTPSPSSSYGFPTVSPLAGGAAAAANSQGDIPYAQPGPRNTLYGYTDQPKISAGYQAQIPLVGWSLGAPQAGTGLAGLNQAQGYASQGGMNYYSLAMTLQAWGQMTPDQRVTVQKQLLASGKYSDAYYPSASGTTTKKPLYGAVADADTIAALTNAWNAASDTGQTLDTVLNAHDAAARNAARIYQQNTQVGIFDQSSASELRSIADQQAIAVLGRKATADEKLLLVSMEQGRQVAYQQGQFNQRVAANRSDAAVQLAGGLGGTLGGATGSSIAGGGSPASVNALVSALGGQESGSPTAGGYGAVNPDSGAAGRFQIMPSNWPSWSQEAGLGPNAPMTPQNQEIVARNKISQYLSDGGGDPAYVAVAWYAGEGTAKAFQADPTNPKWQKPQGKYPSIASYAQSIAGKMAAVTPGTLATQSMAGNVGSPPADGSGGPGNAGSINVGQGVTSGIAAGGAGGGSVPLSSGQSSAGGSVPFGPGLNAQGQSTLPLPSATQVPSGTVTGGQPTPAQLLPASTGIYTQVNTGTDMAEYLRNQNPQAAGAQELANALAAVRQMFHG